MSDNSLCQFLFTKDFLSPFIGAIIGAGSVLCGAIYSTRKDRELQVKKQKDILKSTLSAIRTELKTIYDRYDATAGQVLSELATGMPFNHFYNLNERYFIIFDKNAHILGGLQDRELLECIIETYIEMKGLVDSFRMNNKLVTDNEQLTAPNPSESLENLINQHQKRFVVYGAGLKKLHDTLSRKVPKLLAQISNAVESNNF